MSVEFTQASSTDIVSTSLVTDVTASNFCLYCAVKSDATSSDGVPRWVTLDSNGTFTNAISIGGRPTLSPKKIFAQFKVGATNNSLNYNGYTTGQWDIYILKVVNANFQFFKNTTQLASTGVPGGNIFSGISFDHITIGGRSDNAQDLDGYMARVAIWNSGSNLDLDVLNNLGNGMDPLQYPNDLIFYWNGLTDIYNERFQNASLADVTNSPTLDLNDNPNWFFPE